jgi:hypothetical protein
VSGRLTPATAIRVGDRICSRGLEITVSRIDTPFLGRDDMLAFVEDTDARWLKLPVALDAEVERLSS